MDASTPHGDGLAERIIVDGAWPDAPTDAGADGSSESVEVIDATDDTVTDATGVGDGSADGAADAAIAAPCSLLERACPNKQACYPYPFDTTPAGETRCAFVGAGGPSVPCQTQLECDDQGVCQAPGQPDSACRRRCDLDFPDCPAGTVCRPLPGYSRAGMCL